MSGSAAEIAKDGDRVLAASRRPDGTLRKPVRIRAGYTPQDEVAVYQSKAVQFKQNMPLVPPGYDPEAAAKPKTKAAKKNEKRKERKQQSRLLETIEAEASSSKESLTPELEKLPKQGVGSKELQDLETKISATRL